MSETFVKKLNAKYEDEINKYFTNNLINKKIISEIPKEKYENLFKDVYERLENRSQKSNEFLFIHK